jgi:hypothetical protein
MKKIIAFFFIILAFSSCKKLSDLNKNIKDPTSVSGESLFTGAQKAVFDQMISTNVNYNIFRMFAQYWTETTYTDESNYDLVTRTIPDQHWDVLYRDVLKDFTEGATIITATTYPVTENPAVKKNKLAIIEIMEVYTYSVLVETFGNVPYTQALNIDNVLPVYDDGATVYKNLLTRLDAAIGNLDANYGSFDNADHMYNGNVALWGKFANSLKLRMGMLLSDYDPALAKATVEAAAPNVFTSNADNARMIYLSSQPNTNPIYNDLVASGRHDFVPANTLVDTMNNLNDPRRPYYFTLVDTSTTAGVHAFVYYGGIYGASNDFTQYSHVADKLQEPTFEGLILDYEEVEFLLAEGVERGYGITGTAEGHYNAAITASILYWGGTMDTVAAYLANPKVAYTTATGNFKEKIGVQAWIALYNRGFEAWTKWRLLDYPLLQAPPDALTALPLRYTFPIEEQTLNRNNYEAASAAIGGDDVTTKLFWDKY